MLKKNLPSSSDIFTCKICIVDIQYSIHSNGGIPSSRDKTTSNSNNISQLSKTVQNSNGYQHLCSGCIEHFFPPETIDTRGMNYVSPNALTANITLCFDEILLRTETLQLAPTTLPLLTLQCMHKLASGKVKDINDSVAGSTCNKLPIWTL